MGFSSVGVLVIVLVYLVIAAVLAALVYLVLRLAIRDGLRAHALWVERRTPPRESPDRSDLDG